MLIALVGFNANAAMYIVGSNPFGNWNPGNGVEMTDNGDGTYSYTATITGTVYFVFGDGLNSDWDVFNPDHRYGPATGDENVTVGNWVTTQKAGDHGSYIFTGSGDDYTFTFDEINSQFKIEGYVEPINPLTGHLYALGQVNGNNWNPSAGIEMNTTDENIFTLTEAEIADSGEGFGFFSFTSKLGENAEDWGFQPYRRGAAVNGTLVEDGVVADLANWGSTGAFKVVPGIYDIEVNLSENTVLLTRKGGDVPPVEITVYTVAGPDIIFGSDWDPTDEANDMVKGADGIYTWSKDDVALYGNFEFKIAGNHNFSVYEWPIGQNNWIAKVSEEGIYTIEITFDPEAEDDYRITCNLTKTGDVEHVDHTYTVAGSENVFGSNWNPSDEANDMELPNFGDKFEEVADEKTARKMALLNAQAESNESASANVTSSDLLRMMNVADNTKTFNVIVKGDVQGSVTSVVDSLRLIDTQGEITLNIVSTGVGAISENDVYMASGGNTVIYGFNVSVPNAIAKMAERNGVPVRVFRVIYELLDDAKHDMEEMLDAEVVEEETGSSSLIGATSGYRSAIVPVVMRASPMCQNLWSLNL